MKADPPGVEFLRTMSKFRKKEIKFRRLDLHKTLNSAFSRRSRAVTAKKCKKSVMHVQVVVFLIKPIVCLFLSLRCRCCRVVGSLGSFSNDDGDGNEDVRKAISLLRKTTTLHVHYSFLYISLLSLHDYDVKIPNYKFYGGRK